MLQTCKHQTNVLLHSTSFILPKNSGHKHMTLFFTFLHHFKFCQEAGLAFVRTLMCSCVKCWYTLTDFKVFVCLCVL